MQYENAKDVLPASLLKEVQKYAEGKVLYIPKQSRQAGWGEASGYRERLNKRNALIQSRYSSGCSVMELAEEFFLSPETIKKVVYGKKMTLPEYSPSIASAEQYAKAGLAEEWVRIYLSSEGIPMPDGEEYFLSELARIPIRFIEERKGEERKITGPTSPDITAPAGRPDVPLIVLFENRRFRAVCREEYLTALRQARVNAHYAFVFAKHAEYNYFYNNFGKHFQR